MSECTSDCSSCGKDCASRVPDKEPQNELSNVKKVIGVISGKGGVGKSTVTSMLAVALKRDGYKVAVMDADITGPSIPTAFDVHGCPEAIEEGMLPAVSREGIEIMSINLLLQNEKDPVLWRGPIIAGAVKQFWTDIVWNEVDYMLVDMPPGTGDVALTVFQSLPVDGVIIVTSPQELVSMIVTKAVKMAEMMNVPIIGLVENYSYLKCDGCGKELEVFGRSRVDELSKELGLPALAKLPIDPKLAKACDEGLIEMADVSAIEPVAEAVKKA